MKLARIRAPVRMSRKHGVLAPPRDAQIGEMPARPLADPEAQRTIGAIAQLFDGKGGGGCTIHKDANTGSFDQDPDMEPFVAIGFRDNRLFELIGALGAQRLPGHRGCDAYCTAWLWRAGSLARKLKGRK